LLSEKKAGGGGTRLQKGGTIRQKKLLLRGNNRENPSKTGTSQNRRRKTPRTQTGSAPSKQKHPHLRPGAPSKTPLLQAFKNASREKRGLPSPGRRNFLLKKAASWEVTFRKHHFTYYPNAKRSFRGKQVKQPWGKFIFTHQSPILHEGSCKHTLRSFHYQENNSCSSGEENLTRSRYPRRQSSEKGGTHRTGASREKSQSPDQLPRGILTDDQRDVEERDRPPFPRRRFFCSSLSGEKPSTDPGKDTRSCGNGSRPAKKHQNR